MQAIHFKTAKFDLSKEKENPINPIYGHSLLDWLRLELAGTANLSHPEPEDWGWVSELEFNGRNYIVGACALFEEVCVLKSVAFKFSLMLVGSYFLSLKWWNLWMYDGFIGPIPFLHALIQPDGENSYDLTGIEMHIQLFLIAASAYGYFYLSHKKVMQKRDK